MDAAPDSPPLTVDQHRLVRALIAHDDERAWELALRLPCALPSSNLTAELVPLNAPWLPCGRLQAFALSFDGYAHADQPSLLLAAIREHVMSGEPLDHFTVDDLRCALFALQREFRDAYGAPDRLLVDGLLGAIVARVT